MRIFSLLLLLAVVTGCKHPSRISQRLTPLPAHLPAYRTPTKLATQIARADLTIVTNEILQFGFTLSKDKTREIGKAISSARQQEEGSTPSGILWDTELRFFNGTNYLASVPFEESVFLGDGGFIYDDESGALKKLYRQFLERTRALEER